MSIYYFNGKVRVSPPPSGKETEFIALDIFGCEKLPKEENDSGLQLWHAGSEGGIQFKEFKCELNAFVDCLNRVSRFFELTGKRIMAGANFIVADSGKERKYISFTDGMFNMLDEIEQAVVEAPGALILNELRRRGYCAGHLVTGIVWNTVGKGWDASRILPEEAVIPADIGIAESESIAEYLKSLSGGVSVKSFVTAEGHRRYVM